MKKYMLCTVDGINGYIFATGLRVTESGAVIFYDNTDDPDNINNDNIVRVVPAHIYRKIVLEKETENAE